MQVTLTVIDGELRLANGSLELAFCRRTGRWLSMTDALSGRPFLTCGDRLAPALLTVGGRTTVTVGREHLWSLQDTQSVGAGTVLERWQEEVEEGIHRLTLVTREGLWRLEHHYELAPGADAVLRSLDAAWGGEDAVLLRWADLRVPSPVTTEESVVEAPGYPGILHHPVSALPWGQWPLLSDHPDWDAPAWRPGLVAVARPDLTLMAWGYNEQAPSLMLLRRGDWGLWVTQRLYASCRLRPGESLFLGDQYVMAHRGGFDEALPRFRQFWSSVGLEPEGPPPASARDVRIYEAPLGERRPPEGRVHAPYPEVDALTADLPRIAGLGFNAVQLMPRTPYPGDAVHDYADVESHYGPRDGLRRLVEAAHGLGMRVFLDVVMHGVVDQHVRPDAPHERHPLLWEHPEWFSRTEDGRIARTHTWAFDLAHPGLREHVVEALRSYLRDLGVDGFRVDGLTWNWFPNWAEDLGRPAYESFYGSLPLFEEVRRAIREEKPEALLYTETAGPLFLQCFDLSHASDEQWLYAALLPRVGKRDRAWPLGPPPRRISARQAAEWLELRGLAAPPGWVRVHRADSLDSRVGEGRVTSSREAFGEEAARLLFAFCVVLEGGVACRAGAEAGSEDFYRKLLTLRDALPALRDGECDAVAVRPSDDRVLAPLRRAQGDWALPLLNFSDECLEVEVPLGPLELDPNAVHTLKEALSGETRAGRGADLSSLRATLPPYGVQVWVGGS